MNKMYVYFYATLVVSCMLLADHEGPPCHLEPTLDITGLQKESNDPVIVVGSERKTNMMQSFKQSFNHLSEHAKQKLSELFTHNQEALSQQHQEMKEAVAIALSEYQADFDRQKYMNVEEQEFLRKKVQAKITEICDTYTADKVAFIKHFIRMNQEALACYQERFKEAHVQNAKLTLTKRSLLTGGIIATMSMVCLEMIPTLREGSNYETKALLALVAASLLNLGTHLVPAPQDTKTLQHEMEHKQRTIHTLEAMLAKIKAEQAAAHITTEDHTETE